MIVGASSVLLDFLIYSSIVRSATVSVDVAKASSFLMGTVFTYFANRILTFGHIDCQQGSSWRYGMLYLLTLCTNVIVNAAALFLLRDVRPAVPLAFLTATAISASLNFIGMKWFVFKASTSSETQ
ncbi:GtrA family protein [Steroidobacter gossypii]|uniref:GtrA family protein n=1 Tax=Steroidobacter gossypii TaxID=2805490 RepID=UPI001C3FC92A|nr:GtrA family protein [Steroidobacter gossypii]